MTALFLLWPYHMYVTFAGYTCTSWNIMPCLNLSRYCDSMTVMSKNDHTDIFFSLITPWQQWKKNSSQCSCTLNSPCWGLYWNMKRWVPQTLYPSLGTWPVSEGLMRKRGKNNHYWSKAQISSNVEKLIR